MKILTKLILAAVLLATGLNVEARGGGGHSRGGSSGASGYRFTQGSSSHGARSNYVYRNPYAADPSVKVRGYRKKDGTIVPPHVRTPANDTLKDNLSYRGYGTIRGPRSYNDDSFITQSEW